MSTRSSLNERSGRAQGRPGVTSPGRVPRASRRLPVARRVVASEPGPEPSRVDLETAGALWWSALEAAERALRAADKSLTPQERRELGARLATERIVTVKLLDEVARAQRIRTRFSYLLAAR